MGAPLDSLSPYVSIADSRAGQRQPAPPRSERWLSSSSSNEIRFKVMCFLPTQRRKETQAPTDFPDKMQLPAWQRPPGTIAHGVWSCWSISLPSPEQAWGSMMCDHRETDMSFPPPNDQTPSLFPGTRSDPTCG